MCKGLLLCGRLDLADGRNDDLRNLVNIEFGRIDGEVIIREIVPALIRVEVVVICSLLIAFCDKIGDLLSSHRPLLKMRLMRASLLAWMKTRNTLSYSRKM